MALSLEAFAKPVLDLDNTAPMATRDREAIGPGTAVWGKGWIVGHFV